MPKDSDRSHFKAALAPPALKLQSDERLLTLAREGHEQAFEVIVARYQRPLRSYCRRLLGPDLAQDAVQQTFAAAHAQLLDSDGPVHLRAWLYRVAGNVSLLMLRRRYTDHRELKVSVGDSEKVEPHTAVELDEEVRSMFKQLRRLPERERHALLLKATEGRSFEEIAVILGGTAQGAKQLIYRARRRMRDTLGAILPVPILLWLMRGGKSSGAGKGTAIAAAGGAKHGVAIKLAVAVMLSTGAAYLINATGHNESPPDAKANPGDVTHRDTPAKPSSSRASNNLAAPARGRASAPAPAPSPAATGSPSQPRPGDAAPSKPKPTSGPAGGADDPTGAQEPATPAGGASSSGGENPSDTTPPVTTIDSGGGSTNSTTVTFTFHSSEPGSTFECQIFMSAWQACSSPATTSEVEMGTDTYFQVRATDAAGNTDPTGDRRRLTVEPLPGPAWASPAQFSAGGLNASEPRLVTNASGSPTAIWMEDDGLGRAVMLAEGLPGGGFAAPQTLGSAPFVRDVHLSINQNGDAIVAWTRSWGGSVHRMEAVAMVRPAGQAFGAPQTISDPGKTASDVQVAIDGDGDAIAVWKEETDSPGGEIRAAFRPQGTAFGPSELISDMSGGPVTRLQLAVDDRGSAIVAWTRNAYDGSSVFAADRSDGGHFGTARNFSGPGTTTDAPHVAFGHNGDALLVFKSFRGGQDSVRVAEKPRAGDFGTTKQISYDGEQADDPVVAFDSHDNAMVLWAWELGGAGLRFAERPAGGEFGRPRVIPYASGPGKKISTDRLALTFDRNDMPIAVWGELVGKHWQVRAATRPVAAEDFTRSRPLSNPDDHALHPSLGLDAAGRPVAVWIEFEGLDRHLSSTGLAD